jgi:hypothetical protein
MDDTRVSLRRLRPRAIPLAVWLLAACLTAAGGSAADVDPAAASRFRVRPYLQNPAADGMTIRWLSESSASGTLTCDGRTSESKPVLCHDLAYRDAEPADMQHPAPPYLHSIRVTGLEPSTSYPYAVTQDGETAKAVLTTSPRPGEVGRGGGVRMFFYADSETEPESRSSRAAWPPTASLPGGPRPRWVKDYPADQTTGYRMNLALIATRAAESLRAGNPVITSVVGDLVAAGGEQRDWDEFWRHNAGSFGTLASRVPLVAALGNHDIFGGPPADDPLVDLGGYEGPATLLASRRFLTYFEHPANGAQDERHDGRYHRVDFGPVTLLTLDTTNGGSDDGPDDTNHELDRKDAPHIPDYAPGSEQHAWLKRELTAAQARGAIVFVQFHHAPFSSGAHGRPPGFGGRQTEHPGQPMRLLAPLFREHGVRAVFSGHDEMYEHSAVDGIHYYDVGIGGDELAARDPSVFNDRQIFVSDDHAPERWNGDVLQSGGRHYGHVEVDIERNDAGGFTVTITPAYVFPLLDATQPGTISGWERRTYEDVYRFDVAAPDPDAKAAAETTAARGDAS